jgi:hypothetical protein
MVGQEQLAEWRKLAETNTSTSTHDGMTVAAIIISLLDALEEAEVRASADKQIGRFIKAAADAYEKLRAVEALSEERRRLLEKHQCDFCPECAWVNGHAEGCAWAKAMQP